MADDLHVGRVAVWATFFASSGPERRMLEILHRLHTQKALSYPLQG